MYEKTAPCALEKIEKKAFWNTWRRGRGGVGELVDVFFLSDIDS